jgi:hypothetical protein
MKSIFFVIFLFSVFALNSCAGLRDNENESDFMATAYGTGWYMGDILPSKYITYSKKEIVPLFEPSVSEKNEKSPKLEFFVDTLDILDDAERKLLRQTLYGGLTCQAYVENVYNNVKDEYQNIKDMAIEQPGAVYDWSHIETFDGTIYPSLLVISRRLYSYSGGAHGQNEKTYFVLDTKLLSKLELSDILQAGAEGELQTRIDDDLRTRYRAAPGTPLTSVGFLNDTAGVPQNFFVSREGLGFCWNPYEIAPYAMGTLEVVLPYAQIKNLLNDRGREVFENL